jgi:hypothetical protein
MRQVKLRVAHAALAHSASRTLLQSLMPRADGHPAAAYCAHAMAAASTSSALAILLMRWLLMVVNGGGELQ